MSLSPEQSQLGIKTEYESRYNPKKLFPIPRASKRSEIGIKDSSLPFQGYDIWNHYEVSWLNEKGKPIVAVAQIIVDSHSPNIIESKSMKLYFNTFNNSKFKDAVTVAEVVKKDLEERIQTAILITVTPLASLHAQTIQSTFEGTCIDHLDIECTDYLVDSGLLLTEEIEVEETLHSDLLKSNCLVTGQPDWGSIQIHYKGKKINHAGLLRYIVSFRNHTEFGEHCVERIFMDISRHCGPLELTVHGRYTRRGGIDINSIRSTQPMKMALDPLRLSRQ